MRCCDWTWLTDHKSKHSTALINIKKLKSSITKCSKLSVKRSTSNCFHCFGLSKLFRQCRSWHVTQCRPINSPYITKRFDSSAFLCFHMYRRSVIGQCVVSIHRRYRNLHLRDCCFKSQITSRWRVTCDCKCRAKNIYAITVGRWISSPEVLLFIFIKLLKHECYGYHVRALFVVAARNIQIEFWMLLFSRADFLSDFYRELAVAFWLRVNSAFRFSFNCDYSIARKTVADWREQECVPSSTLST